MPRVVSKARQLRLQRSANLGRQVTLEEVAEQTGITVAALSRIENNKNERIDFETIQKLCTFYGVPVGDLLMIEEEQSANKYSPTLIAA
jgi:putative transcriptional regulator